MIIIHYDPICGAAFPEGRIVEEAAWRIKQAASTELVGLKASDTVFCIGQLELLNEFRLAVIRGQLKASWLKVLYHCDGNGDQVIECEISSTGKLTPWPRGMGDLQVDQAAELITFMAKVARERQPK